MTPQSLSQFYSSIQHYGLSEAELIEICNNAPTEDYLAQMVRVTLNFAHKPDVRIGGRQRDYCQS